MMSLFGGGTGFRFDEEDNYRCVSPAVSFLCVLTTVSQILAVSAQTLDATLSCCHVGYQSSRPVATRPLSSRSDELTAGRVDW